MTDEPRSYPNDVQSMLDMHREKYSPAQLAELRQVARFIHDLHGPNIESPEVEARQVRLLVYTLGARAAEIQQDAYRFSERVKEAEQYQTKAA